MFLRVEAGEWSSSLMNILTRPQMKADPYPRGGAVRWMRGEG